MSEHQPRLRIGRVLLVFAVVAALIAGALYWLQLGPFAPRLGFYQFAVIDGPLQVRSEPAGQMIGQMATGEHFLPDLSTQTVENGFVWIKHHLGYSALHRVDGSERYVDIVITGPDEPLGISPPPATSEAEAPDAA